MSATATLLDGAPYAVGPLGKSIGETDSVPAEILDKSQVPHQDGGDRRRVRARRRAAPRRNARRDFVAQRTGGSLETAQLHAADLFLGHHALLGNARALAAVQDYLAQRRPVLPTRLEPVKPARYHPRKIVAGGRSRVTVHVAPR